jgi:hypothetical protein
MPSGTRACRKYFSSAPGKLAEHREGGEHRQHHRHQRHQRDQGGEGQAAGVRPRRSSRKRWRSVRRVSNQGQRAGSAAVRASRAPQAAPCLEDMGMLAMMPACNLPETVPAPAPPHADADAAAPPPVRALRAWACHLALADRAGPGLGAVAGTHRQRHAGHEGAAAGAVPGRAAAPPLYTYRWLSLLVWLYFTEGVVRATSETGLSQALAAAEMALCLAAVRAVPARTSAAAAQAPRGPARSRDAIRRTAAGHPLRAASAPARC